MEKVLAGVTLEQLAARQRAKSEKAAMFQI
jgi:hypothetical protein